MKITVVLAVWMLAIAAKQSPPVLSSHLVGPAADIAIGLDETTQTIGPLPPAAVENYIRNVAGMRLRLPAARPARTR